MLILIVVMGMGLVFGFFVDYVGDYQRGSGSSVMELVEIEDVYFVEDNRVEVWLYNYGKIEFKVSTVYVNGLLLNMTEDFVFANQSSLDDLQVYLHVDENGFAEVPPNVHAKFNVTLSQSWVFDTSYVFRFVTERGSAMEREYFSPIKED